MTAVPVLVPPASGVLSQPYLTPAMFGSYPHWLDLDDLIPGGAGSVQEDVLADTLLSASDWAVGECENMRLDAHWVQNENARYRMKNTGRVNVRPRDIPLRAVTSLSWGGDPSNMQSVSLPDATMWFEDGRRMSWVPGGVTATFRGPALQFGPAITPSREVYVTWSYVAGYPSTALAEDAAADDMSVQLADPAGILPGDVLRIFDPDASEALTVAAAYVPAVPTIPPTPTAVPLAAAVQNGHVAGTGVTEMPRKILQAVIACTVALLMREDVSAEEPVSGFGPAARTSGGSASGERGGQAAGLVNDAIGWLGPYRPSWRS